MGNYKKDRVLKFFADILSEEEKNQFLSDLRTDEELNNIFRAEAEKNESLNLNPEVNQSYFINMVPEIRAKIDIQNRKKWYFSAPMKFTYTMILLIATGVNFINFDNESFEQKFSIFADSAEVNQFLAEDLKLLDDLLEEDLSTNYNLAGVLEADESFFASLDQDENYSGLLNGNSDLKDVIEEYFLTEEELNKILNELSSEVNL